jgi:hypothetical protein
MTTTTTVTMGSKFEIGLLARVTISPVTDAQLIIASVCIRQRYAILGGTDSPKIQCYVSEFLIEFPSRCGYSGSYRAFYLKNMKVEAAFHIGSAWLNSRVDATRGRWRGRKQRLTVRNYLSAAACD